MNKIIASLAVAVALSACGPQAVSPEEQAVYDSEAMQARLIDGFETDNGERISFIVTGFGDQTDVIVRSNHSDDISSEIMPLTTVQTPQEIWESYSDQPVPAELRTHHDLVMEAVDNGLILLPEAPSANWYTNSGPSSGQGNCSTFAAGYTWSNRYVSPTVSGDRTASLSDMERFRTGACNKSNNGPSEQLDVVLERWTSSISGWDTLFSETLVRGEAVEYSRSLYTCSYYKHRLDVAPSTNSTYYRYAGQWANSTCGTIGIGI